MTIKGQFVDLNTDSIYPATICVEDGKITSIEKTEEAPNQFILPGFVDAHVHIESSMLTPTAFGAIAVTHGTVATISDPHEIANVCGVEGVAYMLENNKLSPFKIFFGAPSCVPATVFETAGATLDSQAVADLLKKEDIYYLTEVMNYPGVLNKDPEVLAKIQAAKDVNKPVDGHAPGLLGLEAKQYAAVGISTDHECTTLPEALDKIAAGMHILIREGSAAKNFDALQSLLTSNPEKVMFCSDDKHPNDLVEGHINQHVVRAVALGYTVFDVLRAACINPVKHYKVPVGLLQIGDDADFIVVDNLIDFKVFQTFINGILLAENGKSLLSHQQPKIINHFNAKPIVAIDLEVVEYGAEEIPVIVALDGQLLTKKKLVKPTIKDGRIIQNIKDDVLKIVVLNRYEPHSKPAIAFINGFGLQRGAIASTVAHDCHNIIAVGATDEELSKAINNLIACQGGVAIVAGGFVQTLPLPIAGLMSDKPADEVAVAYTAIDEAAKKLGSTLHAPFMTLSFMALLVIPSLKLSDLGLFDGDSFSFVEGFQKVN